MSSYSEYMIKDIVEKIFSRFKDVLAEQNKKIDSIKVPEAPDITHLEKRVEDAIAAIPVPKDGENGKSITLDDVKPILDEAISAIKVPEAPDITHLEKRVEDAIAAIKVPEAPDITHLEKRVEDAIAAIPVPKDGISPSADDVATAMEGVFAKWALDFERKADQVLQKAVDRIPVPKDGRDALSIKDFDVRMDEDDRTLIISLTDGENIIEKSVRLAVPVYRDVFSEEKQYLRGDVVTFGGSAWSCLKDAPEGRPGSSEDWRLSVKRGRDGRESVKVEKTIDKVKV